MELYLSQCIESILNQTFKCIELILVDDGSTDNSALICNKYAEKDIRIKYIYQKNKGPIEARRRGLSESECNYVTFVDADDFVDINSFIFSEESIQRNLDIIIFGITRYFDSGNYRVETCNFPQGIYYRSEIDKLIFPQMIWDCQKEKFGIDPSLCNKIIKKSLLISAYQNLKCSNIHYGEDVAILYPLLKKVESLEIIEQSYYYHRQKDPIVLPKYITDNEYFDKLYILYKYLVHEFSNDKRLIEQIEFFYMYSVGIRKGIYRCSEKIRYLFPFDKVKNGEKIVIYGAGKVGQSYMDQLIQLDYCKIILWVDKNYTKYNSPNIHCVEEIQNATYDKLVIAIENKLFKNSIKKHLINLGVVPQKII